MTERLLLIRHGESTWNASERWQGWADCPLTARGRAQALEAAGSLTGFGLTGLVSSDLSRAWETAGILSEALGLKPVEVELDLREYDVGDWCGLTRAEIESGWPGVRDAWRAGRLEALPGGETRARFLSRVVGAVARIMAREDLGPVVLGVSHGGVVRLLERHLGVEADPVPNLGGRWFLSRGGAPGGGSSLGGPELGDRVELIAAATESPTP